MARIGVQLHACFTIDASDASDRYSILVGREGVEPSSTGYEPDASTDKLTALSGYRFRGRSFTSACGSSFGQRLTLPTNDLAAIHRNNSNSGGPLLRQSLLDSVALDADVLVMHAPHRYTSLKDAVRCLNSGLLILVLDFQGYESE